MKDYTYFIRDFTDDPKSPTLEICTEDTLFKILQDKLSHGRKISVYRGECVLDQS